MQVEVWLKIEARKRYQRWQTGAIHAFKTKPTTSDSEIAIKINIEIPDEVFEEPVYEAKLVIPKVTRKMPESSEVMKRVGDELSKQFGFKVRLDIPPIENQKQEKINA